MTDERRTDDEPDATGRQTSQQAAIVRQGDAGRPGLTDAARNATWRDAGGEPGRPPVSVGGSSGGHSDQNAGQGPDEDRAVAGGLSEAERRADDPARDPGAAGG